MRSTIPILTLLLASISALPLFAQCNGGRQSTGGSGAAGVAFGSPNVSMASSLPSSGYSNNGNFNPFAYQQRLVSQQVAYQQQASYQSHQDFLARQQFRREQSNTTPYYSLSRAQRLLDIAQRAEKDGNYEVAEKHYQRVAAMIPDTELGQSAQTAVRRMDRRLESSSLVSLNH